MNVQPGQHAEAQQAPAPPAPPAKKGSPWLKLLLIAIPVLLIVFVIAAALLYKPILRHVAVSEAAKRGVILDLGDISYSFFDSVELTNTRFKLEGVRGLDGEFRKLEISLDGFEPTSLEVDGMDVRIRASATNLVLDLSLFTAAHPELYEKPVTAKSVDVDWASAVGGQSWLRIDDASIGPIPSGGSFEAPKTKVGGVDVGKVGATWTRSGSLTTGGVALGFGRSDLAQAPIRIDVAYGSSEPTAKVTLRPTNLTELAMPLGVALPIQNVRASGTVDLVFRGADGTGPIEGTMSAALLNYVPPHPRELDGIVFGKQTTYQSKLEINPERTIVTLKDGVVAAGAFKVVGGGTIRREGEHSVIDLEYRGSIPCTAIADSAAKSHLGRQIGGIAGRVAKAFLKGAVGVKVTIKANTRDLSTAKLEEQIGIGCGFKGIKIEIPQLPIDLPPLPSGFPPVPTALPSAFPSALPIPTQIPPPPSAFPKFPKLPFPTFGTEEPGAVPPSPD